MKFDKPVIFFDGHCNFCNRWVDWLVRLDKSKKVFIASLQGKTASRILPGDISKDLQTIVLYQKSELFYKSTAIFRLAGIIKGPLLLLLVFCWLPLGLTDRIYDFVAKNRHRFMGQRQTCRVPTKEEKDHFLE